MSRDIRWPESGGIGEGRVVYFLYGLKDDDPTDVGMRREDLASIQDDVALLTRNGYVAVVDIHATRRKLRAALYDRDPDLQGYACGAGT